MPHPVDEVLISSLSSMSLYARSLAKDVHLAESLVQTACERVLQQREQLRHEDVKSYALRIVHNLFVDHIRSSRGYDEFDESEDVRATSPDGMVFTDQLLKKMDKLSQSCRQVLMLTGLGYKQREIAEIARAAAGTIAAAIKRCRDRLRSLWGGQDHG